MLFDFKEEGAVYVTMQGTVDETLKGYGVEKCCATPASDNLFVIRDAPKVSEKEAIWCHSYVAKVLLYIAKRVKPECLTAVSFLTSRVGAYDTDDLGKVRRLLGYIRKTRTAGVCFRIGSDLIIRVYVDAAYGVHIHDEKSHSGAYTVMGAGGPLEAKSGKQKNVTKSSTEAELEALSDHARRTWNQPTQLPRRAGIRYCAGDHLPRQHGLHGDNGERRANIGNIAAYQHPVFLALRKDKVRRRGISAQGNNTHVCKCTHQATPRKAVCD